MAACGLVNFGNLLTGRPSVEEAMKICPQLQEPTFSSTIETADLCLGWFWGPDYEFTNKKGIESVVVGYAGGAKDWPTYRSIQDHTEAIRIEYDTSVWSFTDILQEFVTQHSPYAKPYSRQYRSAILYHNADQKEQAEQFLANMEKTTGKKIYTDIEKATPFYRAEEYHQKYIQKARG